MAALRGGWLFYLFIPIMQYLHHLANPSWVLLFFAKLDFILLCPHFWQSFKWDGIGSPVDLLKQSEHHFVKPSEFLLLTLNDEKGRSRWQFGHSFVVLVAGLDMYFTGSALMISLLLLFSSAECILVLAINSSRLSGLLMALCSIVTGCWIGV